MVVAALPIPQSIYHHAKYRSLYKSKISFKLLLLRH